MAYKHMMRKNRSAHNPVLQLFINIAKSAYKQLGIYRQHMCVSVEVITMGMSTVSFRYKEKLVTVYQKKSGHKYG